MMRTFLYQLDDFLSCCRVSSLLLCLAVLAMPQWAEAQSGGPDAFGYIYSPTSFDFVELENQGNPLFLTDEGEANVSLPWSFSFYGSSYTAVRVGANGGVRFATTSGSIAFGNSCFPATSTTAVDLAIFWDDLNPSSSGDVYWMHDTSAGNDRLILSWEDVPHFSSSGTGSFQAHLYPDGGIEFHWDDTDFNSSSRNHGRSATIGIQDHVGGTNSSSGHFLQYSCNSTESLQGTAVLFSLCSDADGDGWASQACGGLDCDDTDSGVFEGAAEVCDGLDTDCDPSTDEDADEDGDGASLCDGDCDDTEDLSSPFLLEVCNGLDTDCNGFIDADAAGLVDGCGCDANEVEFDATCYYLDGTGGACQLGDSLAPQSILHDIAGLFVGLTYKTTPSNNCCIVHSEQFIEGQDWGLDGADCNSTQPFATGPVLGANFCTDQANFNFNQLTLCVGAGNGSDLDGDGEGSNTDCDDADPANYNGNTEVCDGQDNDCNGSSDADSAGEVDDDQDGVLSCEDCDDNDATSFPGATESCDAVDSNCDEDLVDGFTDTDSDGEPDCVDLDDDGDGDPDVSDCGPLDPSFYLGAPEFCDGFDSDCDGVADADALGEVDGDSDSHLSCADCDDSNASTFPGAAEVCDGLDNDCDGALGASEVDTDLDGWSICAGDCDDGSAVVAPDIAEDSALACGDGLDNDCDGSSDLTDADCSAFAGDDDDSAAGDDDDSAAGDDDDSAAGDDDDSAAGDDDDSAAGDDDDSAAGDDDDDSAAGDDDDSAGDDDDSVSDDDDSVSDDDDSVSDDDDSAGATGSGCDCSVSAADESGVGLVALLLVALLGRRRSRRPGNLDHVVN